MPSYGLQLVNVGFEEVRCIKYLCASSFFPLVTSRLSDSASDSRVSAPRAFAKLVAVSFPRLHAFPAHAELVRLM